MGSTSISKHYSSAGVHGLALCLALALPSCGTESTGSGGGSGTRDTEAPSSDVPVAPDADEPDTSSDGEDVQVEDDGELRLLAITPAFGPTQGNDVVTLSGTGFVDGDVQVYFGPSVAAEVFVLSSTRLTCITPPGPPGLVDVRVTRPSTDASAEILLGYAYQSPVIITAVDPAEGHLLGGEPVTVKGTGFLRGVDSVLFGGRAAIDVVVIDDRTIQLTTPPGELEGPADVRVTTPGGVGLGAGGFLYYATPRLDRAYPGSGSVAGGTEVRLEGAGFTTDAKVTFGGVAAAKVDVLGPSVIVAISPAGSVGSVDLAVTTSRGPAVLDAGFTYIDPASVPVVGLVGVQPNVGSVLGGQTVDLVAYGLPATPEELTVRFDGVPATVTAIQPGKLRATVVTPPGELGPADVAIETPGGNAVLSLGFLYEAALTVTAASPAEGPAAGGTTITITGVGFTAAASVRVGALPCTSVTLVDATTLTCTTAAGSPGGADIRVTVGGKTAVLDAGFNYTTDGIALYAVSPDVGSQAGGTYVTLVGASFTAPLEVTFAGYEATHVTVVSPTEITCRTPPGVVGTVDVQVVPASGEEATLLQSFTYYDPASLFGGTWGPDVVGTLNVTVIDAGNGDRLPDAYVILATDADTPYQGYTSLTGQITFSGPDVLGTQMVSASKEGYESSSVIEFDATNVTLALTPLPPPSSGPPPPGATVSGRVFGLGKYVLVPPPDCLFKELPDGQCESCATDGDCLSTAPNCSTLAKGTYCTADCSADSECGEGYLCSALAGAPGPQCVPAPGKRQARCFLSAGSIFSPLPADETPNIVQDDGTYLIGSRLGEVAIICLGGFVDESNPDTTSNFTPVVAGVARHVNVVPGENTGVDVTLMHPLTRSIKIRLDDPPYRPEINLEYLAALLFWNFGSDGGFMHRTFQNIGFSGFGEPILEIPHQPVAFTGDLFGSRFEILGMALALNDDSTQLPASFTQLTNLKQIDSGSVMTLDAGAWTGIPNLVPRTVHDVGGSAPNALFAVGASGAILYSKGGPWIVQASPATAPLYGVHAFSETDLWAVGDEGTALHFDGVTWQKVPGAGQYDELRAVWGKSPDDVWIVGGSWSGFFHWDGVALTKAPIGGADLRDVHGAGDTLIAVGHYGSVRHYENGGWVVRTGADGSDMNAVHVLSATDAWAVGENGAIWRWDGVLWTVSASPTKRTLRSIGAIAPNDIWAVGDASTLIHWDGTSWQEQAQSGKTTYTALNAVWTDPATGKGVALGTSEVLMGPMLKVPEKQVPADGAKMIGNQLHFEVEPGVPAHFNYITVTIPGLFGDTPVWSITTDGDVTHIELPDFENIEGTPGIGAGTYKLTIIRVYKDDFDIDNYDFSDLDTTRWRSWAIDETLFSK